MEEKKNKCAYLTGKLCRKRMVHLLNYARIFSVNIIKKIKNKQVYTRTKIFKYLLKITALALSFLEIFSLITTHLCP